MEDLSFWALFADQILKVKVLRMDAFQAGFIIPEEAF
jgi:hypothetical protein